MTSSSSSLGGEVYRVYTVCTGIPRPSTTTSIIMSGVSSSSVSEAGAGDVVDNWLRTPFIAVQDAQRVYLDISFTMRQCTTGSSVQRRPLNDSQLQRHAAYTHCTYSTHIYIPSISYSIDVNVMTFFMFFCFKINAFFNLFYFPNVGKHSEL